MPIVVIYVLSSPTWGSKGGSATDANVTMYRWRKDLLLCLKSKICGQRPFWPDFRYIRMLESLRHTHYGPYTIPHRPMPGLAPVLSLPGDRMFQVHRSNRWPSETSHYACLWRSQGGCGKISCLDCTWRLASYFFLCPCRARSKPWRSSILYLDCRFQKVRQ